MAVVIFDETKPRPSDFCREGFVPKTPRRFQNEPVVRGAAPFMADRYNMYAEWEFTVAHAFSSAIACGDFIGNRASIPRAGELQIQFKLGGVTWIRYYKSAFLTHVDPVRAYPVSVDFHYRFVMNSLYSITP